LSGQAFIRNSCERKPGQICFWESLAEVNAWQASNLAAFVYVLLVQATGIGIRRV
jgi:hypothetical protein